MDALEFTPWHQLAPREISADLRDTFSSWDKCMAKSYCKWPAIVGIVVGSIILLSVIWCLVGCICCGYTCCRGCCECCSCCCPSGRNKGGPPPSSYGGTRSKFADESLHHQNPYGYQQSPSIGYQPPAPPVYQQTTQSPSYAQFDTLGSRPQPTVGSTRAVNEDSLPNMPTWQDATTRRVEDTSHRDDELEMAHLDPVTGHSVVDDTGRGTGYYHVPSQPPSPMYPDHHDPNAIGVAHSTYMEPQTSGELYSSRYHTQTPSTIGPGMAAGSGNEPYARSYTRSPAQRIRGTATPSPIPVRPYSPEHPPYSDSRSYSPQYPQYPHQQSPQRSYTAYSPATTSSAQQPWPANDQSQNAHGQSDPAPRAPSLLMAGRRPVENSWRDV